MPRKVLAMCFLVSAFAIANAQPSTAQEKAHMGKSQATTVTPVAIETNDGKSSAKIQPTNTRIEFIGTHVGEDPKPRLGGFKTFEGTIEVAENMPVSIQVEMQISSIWTEFEGLTKHLMNADFFEAEKFAKANFKSTSITTDSAGSCKVSGELSLHGQTSTIEFPASFNINEKGLSLNAKFKIDRTKFGMDKMTDGVEADVSIEVFVGQATRGVEEKAGNGNELSADEAATDTTSMESATVKISLPNMS